MTSQEMIDKIHDIVLNDRRLKVREISETVNISVERVWHILHEFLGMRKLSARWVPSFLSADHNRARVVASEQRLGMFQRNPKEFFRRYVTVDETWFHYYDPSKSTDFLRLFAKKNTTFFGLPVAQNLITVRKNVP